LNLIYLLLLLFASPWLLYATFRFGKYRQGLAAKFLGRVPRRTSDRPCVWLHGVSVGEVNLMGPLIRELQRQLPQYECAISTTTRTGYELAKARYARHLVFYCPLDFSWAVAAALRRIRPEMLVLIELELWPNLIAAARRRGVKTVVVNGRLSPASWRGYRRIGPVIQRVLKRLDLIAAQNQEYADRFLDLGAEPGSVHMTGSLKFDGAETDRQNRRTRQLRQLAGLNADTIVFLAGSTQGPEESLALDAYRALAPSCPRLRLIIVPRHPERFDEVAKLLEQSGVAWRRRSQWGHNGDPGSAPVLLVDTVGELGAWWGTAHIAFVGGSLGRRGGQNMIEPAAYGAAVTFGPNTRNFRDIVSVMLDAQAAVVVSSGEELTRFIARCLQNPGFRHDLGDRSRRLVGQHRGATERSVRLIGQLLRTPPVPPARAASPPNQPTPACLTSRVTNIIESSN
jgi:3-deoxy-D-manno-octulosonic-acid transferase